MGVPGLWDLIRPAATRTSLSALARDAFHSNRNGLRAFTIGIDASIWIFHAQASTPYGENPFLRTIFYKIATLLQHPILPVFVFDGPNKPSRKRNQNVSGRFGTADHRSKQFKALLDVCGLEWWNAPGEAEAELAVMNRQGKIDAVLSDDVDALLFGAKCLLRNNSPTLSGAQASSTQANTSKADTRHYEVFHSSEILRKWAREGSSLKTEEDCHKAMILVALLGGGDYSPEGLVHFGEKISWGLAHAGCAEFLKLYTSDRPAFEAQLPEIHRRIVDELRTNASGQLGRRFPDRARKVACQDPLSIFPHYALDAYLQPVTSPFKDPTKGWPGFGRGESSSIRGLGRDTGRGDLEGMAKACELYFEWGTKDIVCKKFAGEGVGLFGAEIVNEARSAARASRSEDRDSIAAGNDVSHVSGSTLPSYFPATIRPHRLGTKKAHAVTTSATNLAPPPVSPSHLVRICSARSDPTCSEITEYRLAFRAERYTQRCRDAMNGTRPDPKDLDVTVRAAIGLVDRDADDTVLPSSQASSAKEEVRTWIAEYLVRSAWPSLAIAYDKVQDAKALKSVHKAKGKSKGSRTKDVSDNREDTDMFRSYFTQPPSSLIAPTITIGSTCTPSHHSPPRSVAESSSALSSVPSSPIRASLPESDKRSCSVLSSNASITSSASRASSPTTPMIPARINRRTISKAPRVVQKTSTTPCRPASSPCTPPSSKLSSQHTTRRSLRILGSSDAPIDLCCSDDDVSTPRAVTSPALPLRASAGAHLNSSPRATVPISSALTPRAKNSSHKAPDRNTGIPKSPKSTLDSSQTLLDNLIVARPRRSTGKTVSSIHARGAVESHPPSVGNVSPSKSVTKNIGKTRTMSMQKTPQYIVISESEEVEYIQIGRRTR